MKKISQILIVAGTILISTSCNSGNADQESTNSNATTSSAPLQGQSAVQDDVSAKNIVQVASGSADHTTLVAAVKAAQLVDVLSNAGPFTVFAPTNAAFDALPKGTVEGLLKPEKLEALQDILQYHVSVGVYQAGSFQDGQTLGEVNGGNILISKKDGKIMINGNAKLLKKTPRI